MSRSVGTTRPASSTRMARSARCFGPPSATCPVSSETSSGPSIRNSSVTGDLRSSGWALSSIRRHRSLECAQGPLKSTVSALLDGRCRPVGGPSDRAGHDYLTHHLNPRRARRTARSRCSSIAALALDSVAQASAPGTGCSGSYGWPVKPFDRPHPIRGGFGDPRTVFQGTRSQEHDPRGRRRLLVPPGPRHLRSRRVAGLCGRIRHGRAGARRPGDRRLRQRSHVPVLAHRARGSRRTARDCRRDAARLRPAEARARSSDTSRERARGQSARSETPDSVQRRDDAERSRSSRFGAAESSWRSPQRPSTRPRCRFPAAGTDFP